MTDAGDAVGGLIGLGIGLIVLDKVVDVIDEHHHERRRNTKPTRKVRHTENDETFGGVF